MASKSRLLLGLLLLLLVLAGVQWAIGWNRLLAPWRTISPPTLALTALLTLSSYAARALRLYDYFLPATRGSFTGCFKLTLLHNLFNNLLPMRTGEVSFPVLMSRYFAIPLGRSLAALLWFRLMDLHALAAVALAAVGTHWLSGWSVGLLAVAWLSLPWWLFRLQPVSTLAKFGQRLPPRWRARLAGARDGLPQTPATFWRAWFWTLLNWLVKLVVFAWILQLLAPLPAAAAFLGAIGGDLTSVLPVHGVAGAGTYEAGVVAALLPFGVPAAAALAAAVNLHLFMLGLSLVGGALALLLRHELPATETLRNYG
ncbi:MAG TPA: lysylphosphatidylglycerol synthase domain-containing protein [Candidatus Competibacter sp.]|nr:lysylphosphatidylglycerol synthase domain-containing protein [Candidatus Competibacter sp.]